jgi:hypothetical protein
MASSRNGHRTRGCGGASRLDLVNRYNEIIDDVETDPSLKIEFRQ